MIKKIFFLSIIAISCLGLIAEELRPLSWSEKLNHRERFYPVSSGNMEISWDAAEKAVCFDIRFDNGNDFWAYPRLQFKDGESLADVETIQFEYKAVQADEKAGYVCALATFDSGKSILLPNPKNKWQTVTIKVTEVTKEPGKVSYMAIGMNPKSSRLTYWVRNIKMFGNGKASAPVNTAGIVKADVPGMVFTRNEVLEFSLDAYIEGPVEWILTDWQGEQLATGEWPENGKGKLSLPRLPDGYYMLKLQSSQVAFTGSRSFVVVPDPDCRRRNPDAFFAVDSAQVWLAGSAGYDAAAEIARRAGLVIVRDRMSWSSCEPERGKYSWGNYLRSVDAFAKRGISVCNTWHDAPDWAKNGNKSIPGDMVAVFRFAQELSRTFKDKVRIWEFWNEQDIGFALDGAWDYAAAMKAAYLGFKAGNPDTLVASGGLSKTDLINYSHVMMQNGLKDYFDIFNLHAYAGITAFPNYLSGIQSYMKRYGISGRRIEFTEVGSIIEGSGRAAGLYGEFKAHSPEQEMLVAEFLPKLMLNMQNLGVDRSFFFVLLPYNEQGGAKDWGLLRRDFSAKPGYAAFSNMMNELGCAELEGTLRLGKDIVGFLYRQPDGTQTVAYWSLSDCDVKSRDAALNAQGAGKIFFSIPVKEGIYSGTNIFGTPFLAESKSGKLTLQATSMVSYINGLSGLKPVTQFHARKTIGSPIQVDYDRTIVYHVKLSDHFEIAADKDCASVKQDEAAFILEVWNLSDQPKKGRLQISGGKVIGLPGEIFVPPFGKYEVGLHITPKFDGNGNGKICVAGVFNGENTSPLLIPLLSLEKMMKASRTVNFPQMLDPANWRRNASARMEISFDKTEQAVRFLTDFPKTGDCWVYPEYVFQLPQESLRGALGIAFEVKVQEVPAKGFYQMLVMPVLDTQREKGKSFHLRTKAPSAQWEKRYVPLNSGGFNPADIRQIRIGLNWPAGTCCYWLRNAQIIYSR